LPRRVESAWWESKGECYLGLKRYQDALIAFDRALALTPTRAMAWRKKAAALRGLGRGRDAKNAEGRAKALGGK